MVIKPFFCCVKDCDCIKTIKDDCLEMCVGESFSPISDTCEVKGFYFCRNNKAEGWHRFFIKEEYLDLFISLADTAKQYKEKL